MPELDPDEALELPEVAALTHQEVEPRVGGRKPSPVCGPSLEHAQVRLVRVLQSI